MPQITLEYTANILEKDLTIALSEIHRLICEMLKTEMSNCKSRVQRVNDYLIGEGEPDNAFVHLTVAVLSGRSSELLQSTGEIILHKLKNFFHQSLQKLNLQITVAIENLPEVYVKYSAAS